MALKAALKRRETIDNEGVNGGETGIRTLGGDKPSTVFKTRRFQPLSHLSESRIY